MTFDEFRALILLLGAQEYGKHEGSPVFLLRIQGDAAWFQLPVNVKFIYHEFGRVDVMSDTQVFTNLNGDLCRQLSWLGQKRALRIAIELLETGRARQFDFN